MLKEYKADLHIHSCLSPCAELEMTPARIVQTASARGLSIIAVTDHNSAENIPYVQKAAENTGVSVLAGIEVTSSEEVHIIALFERAETALKMQEKIYNHLPPLENDDRVFGQQVVVNEADEVITFNRRLLIGSTELNTQSVLDTIRSLGGISIASHIDREAFGILSQLGFIPGGLDLDALEISPKTDRKTAEKVFMEYRSFPWVTSSDAHHPRDIGRKQTGFIVEAPTFLEVASALKGRNGRKVLWE